MNIRQLLQLKAKKEGIAYRQLLTHYAMERFLYRLSTSTAANRFYLKGGMLLMGMGAVPARTTMDIDLLGRIDRTPENIKKAFNSILHSKAPAKDQVTFSSEFKIVEIMKDALYTGIRVSLTACVCGDSCPISIDIGFSDEVYPEPIWMEYPPSLPEVPPVRLLCYTKESMVAEKWQAMVQLGRFNSRMKDFYDLWFLSRSYNFQYQTLREAIERTFQRRGTEKSQYLILFESVYAAAQQPEWSAYVSKLKAASFHRKLSTFLPSRELTEVLAEIRTWLEPVMDETSSFSNWKPGKGWQ